MRILKIAGIALGITSVISMIFWAVMYIAAETGIKNLDLENIRFDA